MSFNLFLIVLMMYALEEDLVVIVLKCDLLATLVVLVGTEGQDIHFVKGILKSRMHHTVHFPKQSFSPGETSSL